MNRFVGRPPHRNQKLRGAVAFLLPIGILFAGGLLSVL
jgi:hypothetical protein